MRKILLIYLFLVGVAANNAAAQCYSSPPNYKQLLYIATHWHPLLAEMPLHNVYMTKEECNNLLGALVDGGMYADTTALLEIDQRGCFTDTARWTVLEIPIAILVRDTAMNRIRINKKWKAYLTGISDDSVRIIADKTRKMGSMTDQIFYYSRPIFDHTMTYALFEYRFYNMIGKGVSLFHFDGSKWIELVDSSSRF